MLPGVWAHTTYIIVQLQLVFNQFFYFSVFFLQTRQNFSAREEQNMSKLKRSVFEGAATALVTPFKNGAIDFESFGKLIDTQIANGIDAIVVAGTTGEAATLTHEEHCNLLRFAAEYTAGRVPVIAGTGSNDTAYAIELTSHACEAGADAVLVVTPYYNKATQKGLIEMFTAIADASTVPVIL